MTQSFLEIPCLGPFTVFYIPSEQEYWTDLPHSLQNFDSFLARYEACVLYKIRTY